MEFSRHKKPVRPISMVPLINVVFLLLIFFLVAGTVERVEVIDVELPESVSGELIEEGPLQILRGHYDEIIINDTPLVMAELKSAVIKVLSDNVDRVITIKADARMQASRLVEVMDILTSAGAKNISLTTQQL